MPNLVEIAHKFQAMNTDIEVVVCVTDGQQYRGREEIESVKRLFEANEKTLSRFSPESELSKLNASAGRRFKASSLLFKVVRASVDAARITHGVFDPVILSSLAAAGYDKSFEKLREQSTGLQGTTSRARNTWQDIHLDQVSLTIEMPPGCTIDLGGIGKGWTVDQAGSSLEHFPGYAIDAGGDIRVKGKQSNGSPWTIGVADPLVDGHNLAITELGSGAICTSTTTRRKWYLAGTLKHHLIDPRTGIPSDSGVISATVMAESAVLAETVAKAAVILGVESGLRLIESQPGTSGILVTKEGKIYRSSGFREMLYAA